MATPRFETGATLHAKQADNETGISAGDDLHVLDCDPSGPEFVYKLAVGSNNADAPRAELSESVLAEVCGLDADGDPAT